MCVDPPSECLARSSRDAPAEDHRYRRADEAKPLRGRDGPRREVLGELLDERDGDWIAIRSRNERDRGELTDLTVRDPVLVRGPRDVGWAPEPEMLRHEPFERRVRATTIARPDRCPECFHPELAACPVVAGDVAETCESRDAAVRGDADGVHARPTDDPDPPSLVSATPKDRLRVVPDRGVCGEAKRFDR